MWLKSRARDLLKRGQIHFIGSDAHRISHRPPDIESGIAYIKENADAEYAKRILSGNALSMVILSQK